LTSSQEHPKAFDGVEILKSVQRVINDNDKLRKEVGDKIVFFISFNTLLF